MSEGLLGHPPTGHRIVGSNGRGCWKAAVPLMPVVAWAAFLLLGPWTPAGAGGQVWVGFIGAAFLLAAIVRTMIWYLTCDDSLWDDGRHLLWVRRGRVASCVAWDDLITVGMDPGARFPAFYWGLWERDSSALPRVYVSARACPASRYHLFYRDGETWGGQFASLVLTDHRPVTRAKAELDQVCARYVTPRPGKPRTIAEAMAAQRPAAADEAVGGPQAGSGDTSVESGLAEDQGDDHQSHANRTKGPTTVPHMTKPSVEGRVDLTLWLGAGDGIRRCGRRSFLAPPSAPPVPGSPDETTKRAPETVGALFVV